MYICSTNRGRAKDAWSWIKPLNSPIVTSTGFAHFLTKKNTEMSINFFCKPMSGQESFHISPKVVTKSNFCSRMLSDSDHVRVQMSETRYGNGNKEKKCFFRSLNYIVTTKDSDMKVLKTGPLPPLYSHFLLFWFYIQISSSVIFSSFVFQGSSTSSGFAITYQSGQE